MAAKSGTIYRTLRQTTAAMLAAGTESGEHSPSQPDVALCLLLIALRILEERGLLTQLGESELTTQTAPRLVRGLYDLNHKTCPPESDIEFPIFANIILGAMLKPLSNHRLRNSGSLMEPSVMPINFFA